MEESTVVRRGIDGGRGGLREDPREAQHRPARRVREVPGRTGTWTSSPSATSRWVEATFEPGWRWSNDVKPIAGTDSCQARHAGICLEGEMTVRSDDGTEMKYGPGDVFVMEPGHDAWVDGTTPCIMFDTGVAAYAKTALRSTRRRLSPSDRRVLGGSVPFAPNDEPPSVRGTRHRRPTRSSAAAVTSGRSHALEAAPGRRRPSRRHGGGNGRTAPASSNHPPRHETVLHRRDARPGVVTVSWYVGLARDGTEDRPPGPGRDRHDDPRREARSSSSATPRTRLSPSRVTLSSTRMQKAPLPEEAPLAFTAHRGPGLPAGGSSCGPHLTYTTAGLLR